MSIRWAADADVGIFLPASGYRNNGDLNNAGSNGNYWSSSVDDSNNAWEFNFNSGNVNLNNNNRNYGQTVRAVRCSTYLIINVAHLLFFL